MRIILVFIGLLVLAAVSVPAQTSASYTLEEWAFNAGGRPLNGVASSPSFKISLDAIGDPAVKTGLASASFRMDSAFVSFYPPPGEAEGLRFQTRTQLVWEPEKSVGVYNLYRALVSSLPGNFGDCFLASITEETWTDPGNPGAGNGWLYLVTAENRLAEEGTKGFQSSGVERLNPAPCP